jgi:hypothetical protein
LVLIGIYFVVDKLVVLFKLSMKRNKKEQLIKLKDIKELLNDQTWLFFPRLMKEYKRAKRE